MFSIMETRLDITFAMFIVNCFSKNPSQKHRKFMNIILRYMKNSKQRKVTYNGQDGLLIKGYLDSNLAEDLES